MPGTGLNLGQEHSSPRPEVVDASTIPPGETIAWVASVLGGAVLALAGDGPLLPALHLRRDVEEVSGTAEPQQAGLAPVAIDPLAPAHAVTGAGYALYRCGDRCIALAGPRGDGWVLYLGGRAPDLESECLRWVELRSQQRER
jgi:hypothetical protein